MYYCILTVPLLWQSSKQKLFKKQFWTCCSKYVRRIDDIYRVDFPTQHISIGSETVLCRTRLVYSYSISQELCTRFCFAVLCCGYTLTDFPISTRLTSLALWQSNDCPSASKATLMNMDEYFMWIHYERLRIHNKAKHNKTVCIFLGIYCIAIWR